MHFWSHAFCTIARLPFLVLKYAVARCLSCSFMPQRSCECVKQIHITCALYASHAWWVHNFSRLQRCKFWLNMVSFILLKKDLFSCYIKKIMNVFHSCNGTNIFIRRKMKCSIQLGFASLNGTFHLSPHKNICTTALINIHYLYNIISHF